MATYTYDPTQIKDGGLNQMRFELGDTIVDMEGINSALCDEEYQAILDSEKSWKRAKYECVKAIVMKLSFEVDTSVDGLSYSLSQRFTRWKELEQDLKKKTIVPIPTANPEALQGPHGTHGGPPYFYANLHKNPGRRG